MGFPTSHQPRSCVTCNFPEMGFRYPNLSFFRRNFDQNPFKVCHKVSLSKNFQRQSCSAISYLSNGISILAEYDPVPVKLRPKTPTSNRKDTHFTFHTWRAVQSAIADVLVKTIVDLAGLGTTA